MFHHLRATTEGTDLARFLSRHLADHPPCLGPSLELLQLQLMSIDHFQGRRLGSVILTNFLILIIKEQWCFEL